MCVRTQVRGTRTQAAQPLSASAPRPARCQRETCRHTLLETSLSQDIQLNSLESVLADGLIEAGYLTILFSAEVLVERVVERVGYEVNPAVAEQKIHTARMSGLEA